MTKLVLAGTVLLLAAAPLAAQGRPTPPRTVALRGQIEEAFMRRTTQELALTPDQATKMSQVVGAAGERRRALEVEQQQSQMALNRQLRPGVAANQDSLTKLVDRIAQNRVEYAEAFRSEMRDLAPILSPVQRAQYLQLRDRLLERIRDLQQNRPAAAGQGARP